MDLNLKEVERIIVAALAEDIGKGDVTARLLIPEETQAVLFFVTREPVIVCGTDIVPKVFAQLDPEVEVQSHAKDGEALKAGARMVSARGPARSILTGERTALNLLQRMSSVATLTARYVRKAAGTKAVILDTRKTMPGLRALDKYAVRTGGGRNHRMRLDDGILIKDNHIALCGGVTQALRRAQAGNTTHLPIEIECDTRAQAEEAVEAGAESILLDNMPPALMREIVAWAKGRAKFEASGNISLETLRAAAETGVDFISVGKLTHSAPNVDIGLDITFKPKI